MATQQAVLSRTLFTMRRARPLSRLRITRIEQLTQYFVSHGVLDRTETTHRALVGIGKIVQRRTFILAFSDTFFLPGAALVVDLIAALLLKKPDHLESGGAH
jgi:DHA2 family multidrug resistance protein